MRAKAASWTEQLGKLFLGAGLLCLPLLAQAASEDDPWESINRPIFTFNDTLDTYALKPLAQGYQAITPQFLEDGIHNMFGNVGDVGNLANNLLQGKLEAAGVDTSRVLFNTTFGLLGFFDVGTKMCEVWSKFAEDRVTPRIKVVIHVDLWRIKAHRNPILYINQNICVLCIFSPRVTFAIHVP